MSVRGLLEFQETILLDWMRSPRAWLVQANPVWGSFETINKIALFDTREQAAAYIEASKLPETLSYEARKTSDGYVRTFRSDSLLFDYNPEAAGSPMVVPAIPWHNYRGIIQNPACPTGTAPDMSGNDSAHLPRYGEDYDRGLGGPYTNMDHVIPEAPK